VVQLGAGSRKITVELYERRRFMKLPRRRIAVDDYQRPTVLRGEKVTRAWIVGLSSGDAAKSHCRDAGAGNGVTTRSVEMQGRG
jgi:hypothetical protein